MAAKNLDDLKSQELTKGAEEIEDRRVDPLNTLGGLSTGALQEFVDNFVTVSELTEDRDFFIKAAVIAQNHDNYEGLVELAIDEEQALNQERHHKWKHPWKLWFTIATCSVGGAVHGWDQTGSNGANLSFPKEFGIASNSSEDQWILGLVNSAPTFAIFLFGCWVSDPLNNLVGRRGTILVSAIFSFGSVLGSAFTQKWQQILACRLLLGAGMGIKASTTAVFAAECSPTSIRGALSMTWQLWVAIGIFLGFTANLVVMNAGDITWRLRVPNQAILCLLCW